MREIRIFSPVPLSGNTRVELTGSAARHIRQVLRMQAGQAITLFDGNGGEFPAVIDSTGRTTVTVTTQAHRPVERESSLHLTLWHGLCRGERMDSVVQKATELGVQIVQPVAAARSMVKLSGARADKKLAHWQAVAVSACEQCGRNRVPEIKAPEKLTELFATAGGYDRALLLDPHGGQPLDTRLNDLPADAKLLLCCGPEGGFSAEEVAAANAAGMQPVHLGPRVLRTETAPLAALAIVQLLAGDLRQSG